MTIHFLIQRSASHSPCIKRAETLALPSNSPPNSRLPTPPPPTRYLTTCSAASPAPRPAPPPPRSLAAHTPCPLSTPAMCGGRRPAMARWQAPDPAAMDPDSAAAVMGSEEPGRGACGLGRTAPG